jgi:hypothetical protein
VSTVAGQPPEDAPTFSQCVLGYRAWIADAQDQLWSLSSSRRPWRPGLNVARCRRTRIDYEPLATAHVAPDAACSCGLYSWRQPRKNWYSVPRERSTRQVFGAVASWGLIHVHADGFRAEYSCVVALGYHPRTSSNWLAELERISARYRVQLVPLAELERAAGRYGAQLPVSAHPAKPAAPSTRPLTARRGVAKHATAGEVSPPPGSHPSAIVPRRAKAQARMKLSHAYALFVLMCVIGVAVGLWHLGPDSGFDEDIARCAQAALGVVLIRAVVGLVPVVRQLSCALAVDSSTRQKRRQLSQPTS